MEQIEIARTVNGATRPDMPPVIEDVSPTVKLLADLLVEKGCTLVADVRPKDKQVSFRVFGMCSGVHDWLTVQSAPFGETLSEDQWLKLCRDALGLLRLDQIVTHAEQRLL